MRWHGSGMEWNGMGFNSMGSLFMDGLIDSTKSFVNQRLVPYDEGHDFFAYSFVASQRARALLVDGCCLR